MDLNSLLGDRRLETGECQDAVGRLQAGDVMVAGLQFWEPWLLIDNLILPSYATQEFNNKNCYPAGLRHDLNDSLYRQTEGEGGIGVFNIILMKYLMLLQLH